jgi:hypothetical protein
MGFEIPQKPNCIHYPVCKYKEDQMCAADCGYLEELSEKELEYNNKCLSIDKFINVMSVRDLTIFIITLCKTGVNND